MPGWQRAHVAASSAIIGFSLAYVGCHFLSLPKLTYFQHARAWRMVAHPSSPLPSAYPGMIVWGLCGAFFAAVIALAATRLRSRPLPDLWLRLFGLWAEAAVVIAGGYFAWQLLWPAS